jgi:diguanylate cyclase (GGDEF)-like protein/PAS domain S-box-containing protein
MATQLNRRRDEELRAAISVIQQTMFDPLGAKNIIEETFHQGRILAQADVAHCCVFTAYCSAMFETIDEDCLIFHDKSDAIRNSSVKGLYAEQSLPKTSMLFNGKIPLRYAEIFNTKFPISASLFLPMRLHGKDIAFIVLAKTEGFFETSVVARLSSLTDAALCALQNSEAVRGSFTSAGQDLSSNAYISSLISSSPSALLLVNQDKMITLCNPRSIHLFRGEENNSYQSLIGLPIENFIPDYESFFQWSSQVNKFESSEVPKTPVLWEKQPLFLLDGSSAQARISLFQYHSGKEVVTTLQIDKVVEVNDTSSHGVPEPTMLLSLMDLMPISVLHLNTDLTLFYMNEMWVDVSGLSYEECEGTQWAAAIHNEDSTGLLRGLQSSMNTMGEYRQEVRLVSPMGVVTFMDFFAKLVVNEQGQRTGILCTFTDITDTIQTTQKLTNVAHFDGLTGLANRLLFQDRLEQAFIASERERSKVCLMFLDLDGFKQVNDEMGHDAGDVVLKLVAQRLQDILRRNDTIGRFGGDEFVVLLGHDDHDTEIITVADKIIKLISMPYTVHQREVRVTVSIGIAQGTSGDSNPRKLLKQADSALYLAKDDGKNNYKIFDEKLDAEARKRNFLVNQLRRGLKQNSYSLHYQPIIDIESGSVRGFEALLRFTDVNNVLVMPDEFIHILEETSLILPVGDWIIREVCAQIANWKIRDLFPENGYVSFNVSAKQLHQPDIFDVMNTAVIENNLQPGELVMEMTESVLIDDDQHALQLMEKIRTIGIKIALDDFGTGYSSLSYLQAFPFDLLKIDKSFMLDVAGNSGNKKICTGIIALAHSLEIKVVAEGVEEVDAYDFLRAQGVELCQGYYFSRPLPETAIKTFLKTYNAKIA